MGQKVNPIIFRLSKTKNWESKYFEKKSNESPIYAYKNLEIKEFIKKFLKNYGLMVHRTKLYYSEKTLRIFVSYFLSPKFSFLLKRLQKNQNIRVITSKLGKFYKRQKSYKQRYNKIIAIIKKYYTYTEEEYHQNLLKTLKRKHIKAANKAIVRERQVIKFRRLLILQNFKKSLAVKRHQTIKEIKCNSFLEKFFESLSLFTDKKLNICLSFKQINKNILDMIPKRTLKDLKTSIAKLRRYQQNEFFNSGVNLILYCTINKNSSRLLAEFLADNLKKLKRHNFFLKFVKATLSLFSKKDYSSVEGIKIKIKGRFNGRPRARSKTITIKNGAPMTCIKSKIDYSEATSFTANGTFGVKVWMHNIKKLLKKRIKNYAQKAKTKQIQKNKKRKTV